MERGFAQWRPRQARAMHERRSTPWLMRWSEHRGGGGLGVRNRWACKLRTGPCGRALGVNNINPVFAPSRSPPTATPSIAQVAMVAVLFHRGRCLQVAALAAGSDAQTRGIMRSSKSPVGAMRRDTHGLPVPCLRSIDLARSAGPTSDRTWQVSQRQSWRL